ncbi:hypothetical protein TSO5_03585, partial [Azospirillum sp. TSO5]
MSMVALQPAPAHADTVTILECTEDHRATKRIRLGPGATGTVIDGYDAGTWFMAREVPVNSFDDLAALLQQHSANPKAFVIRGAASGAWSLEFPVRRTSISKPMQPAAFRAQPRRWLAIDMDKVPMPAGTDPVSDPDDAIEYLRGQLPDEFQEASCWWQFTSGQGFKGDTLNARLWFWLDRPLNDVQLRTWARERDHIDAALYNAAEPHYIAAPILGPGVRDPLPRRSGVHRGETDEVMLRLPEREEMAAREWTRQLAADGGTEVALHEVVDYLNAIPNDDLAYDEWLSVGSKVKAAVGDAGEDAFVEWSARSKKHDDDVARRKYRSLQGGGSPLALYLMARDHGYTFDHIFDLGAIRVNALNRANRSASAGAPELQEEDEDWEMEDPIAPAQPITQEEEPNRSVLIETATNAFPEPVGLLRDIRDHIVASAIYPQPELALAASLAIVGTAMGRRYTFGSNIRANLYLLGIAPSGSGKGHVLGQVEQILEDAKLGNCLGGMAPASGAAVNSRIVDHPVTIYAIDEFGMFLKAALDSKAPPHMREVVNVWTQLYTKSAGRYSEKDRADRKAAAPRVVQHPHLTVFGVTAETHVWSGLNTAALTDGSIARFMVFESREDYPYPVFEPKSGATPPGIAAALRTVYDRGGDPNAGNLAGVNAETAPSMRPVSSVLAAEAMFREAMVWEWQNRKKHAASGMASIYGRFVEQAKKLAFIHAVGRDPYRATVEEIDAQWGLDLASMLIDHVVRRASENVAENEQERRVKTVLKLIREAPGGKLPMNELTRRTQGISTRDRRDIIDVLAQSGQI